MRTILVDDEPLSMEQFEHVCRGMNDIKVVGKFNDAMQAWEYARQNRVDFALLDVEMPQMNGLELGKKLRQINEDMVLMYVTGYTQYIADALRLRADYCIMKPYDRQDAEEAIKRARLLSGRQQKRVQVKMFGRFQVFIDGQNVCFRNAKARELLALCIDHRGGLVSMEEAIDKLWEERPYDEKVKRLYRKAVASLQAVLKEYGMADIFVNRRGACYVLKDRIECDLYTCFDTNQFPEDADYLFDYPWGEESIGQWMNITGEPER